MANPTRVIDIYPGSRGSDPWNFIKVNNTLYFTANDGVHGVELWKTDGTAAGTVLVKDIRPGSESSFISNSPEFVNVNGTLFFVVGDDYSKQLWKSDGTAAGTVLVKDAFTYKLTNVNGTLYFRGLDAYTYPLWKSDGTAAGTVVVQDTAQKTFNPSFLTEVNNTLFFGDDNAGVGSERGLWKSDGTPAGTVLVKSFVPETQFTNYYYENRPASININGILYFKTVELDIDSNGSYRGLRQVDLWKSNGTEAGTTLVRTFPAGSDNASIKDFTNVNGTLYFIASSDGSNFSLWKSNGTSAGTVLVKDSVSSSSLQGTAAIGNTLYFVNNDPSTGYELWKSDGTTAGTVLVKDIQPGTGSGGPGGLTNINGTLYFSADDGINGRELWKSDGTAAGTVLVQDISPELFGSLPSGFIELNGFIYFSADDGSLGKLIDGKGRELWRLNPNAPTVGVPQLAIVATDANKNEGNSGFTPFTFTVTRSGGDLSGTSNVDYIVSKPNDSFEGVTATDFGGTVPLGTITFAANETSKVITINVSGDTRTEPDEEFTVVLSSPINARITTTTALGTIINDDIFSLPPIPTPSPSPAPGSSPTPSPSPTSLTPALEGTSAPDPKIVFSKITNRKVGTARPDVINGGSASELLNGGAGNDRLSGNQGDDWLIGGQGNDRAKGGAGNDRLESGAGNDTLIGGAGSDRLVGGMGVDILTGGAGKDLFVLDSTGDANVDTITDFKMGEDLIDLRPIFSKSGYQSAALSQVVKLIQVGANTEVWIDADGLGSGTALLKLATLQNLSVSTLSARQFVIR